MQLPMTLALQPSRQLTTVLWLAHAGALAVVVAITLPIWIKLLLLAAIAISGWRVIRRLYGIRRIVRLTLRSDGLLEYLRSNAESGEARVHPHTIVTPWLSVLLLQPGRRIEVLVVLPDALGSEDFRQLRLWLRWRAAMD